MRLQSTQPEGYKTCKLRDVPAGTPFLPAHTPTDVAHHLANKEVLIRCVRGSYVETQTAGEVVCRLSDGLVTVRGGDQTVTLVDATVRFAPVPATPEER